MDATDYASRQGSETVGSASVASKKNLADILASRSCSEVVDRWDYTDSGVVTSIILSRVDHTSRETLLRRLLLDPKFSLSTLSRSVLLASSCFSYLAVKGAPTEAGNYNLIGTPHTDPRASTKRFSRKERMGPSYAA